MSRDYRWRSIRDRGNSAFPRRSQQSTMWTNVPPARYDDVIMGDFSWTSLRDEVDIDQDSYCSDPDYNWPGSLASSERKVSGAQSRRVAGRTVRDLALRVVLPKCRWPYDCCLIYHGTAWPRDTNCGTFICLASMAAALSPSLGDSPALSCFRFRPMMQLRQTRRLGGRCVSRYCKSC